MPELTPEEKLQVTTILNQAAGLPEVEPASDDQRRFRRGFSVGALVYNFFYYQAMRDTLFMWLSLLFSIVVFTLPLLIVLAFFARERAWKLRKWQGAGEYQLVQRRWDRSGWYGMIITVFLLYFLLNTVASSLNQTLDTLDPEGAGMDSKARLERIQQLKESWEQ